MPRRKAGTVIEKLHEEPGKSEISNLNLETPEALPSRTVQLVLHGSAGIEMWAMDDLSPHPDNPRTVNTKGAKFAELVESIRRNGIITPLTVRPMPQIDDRDLGLQVLDGHRRLAAAREAGLTEVPIRNLGLIADDLAFDIVALANMGHEDLTPLEEGKRAATWLDKYSQDVKAVGSKLGKSPHWILTHAMIERNLIPAWKEEAARVGDDWGGRRDYSHWTAAHWVQIARLPAPLQEYWLKKVKKDYRFSPDCARAATVAKWLATETLILAKAAFDWERICNGCPNRTDAISQLLWQDPDLKAEEGEAVRCLDPKCWERRSLKAQIVRLRNSYETATSAAEAAWAKRHKGEPLPSRPVAISTIDPVGDWCECLKYQEEIKAAKKGFGKEFLEVDAVELVKERTRGAVPAIIVVGADTGSLKWVKIKPASAGRRQPTRPPAEEVAKQEAEDWEIECRMKVVDALSDKMCAMQCPAADVVLLAAAFIGCHTPWGDERIKVLKAARAAIRQYPGQPVKCVTEWVWGGLSFANLGSEEAWEAAELLGPVLGFDVDAEYERVKADLEVEELQEEPKPEKEAANAGKAKSKTKKSKAKPGVCRICGCTELNCPQCIEAAGEACQWADGSRTICTRCVCPVQAGKGECLADGNCKACGRKTA
jgi:ParB/RepB/Spo0J family partition protein